MKGRVMISLRAKLVLMVIICGASALLMSFLLYMLSERIYRNPIIHDILYFLSSSVGIQAMLYITAFILFVVFMLIVSRSSVKYLESIVRGIRKMESGDLDTRIDVRTGDELGALAEAVNSMAAQLKRSIEEERAIEDSKKELISSVSHDLRTPLTSVIGFLGLLNDRGAHTDEDLERYAVIAHKKALRLKELIDDLFEYTRVSYSGIRVNSAALDIQELMRQLAEEYFPVFEEQGMEIRQEYSDEKLEVNGDGELLMRLFENLIQNALRYGREGKTVGIRVSREGGFAAVRVINRGNPIPDEKLPYIFDRFYRIEESRSRETGGSGLGLSIAKSIAELHKGHIGATSDGIETCFRVLLPLSSEGGVSCSE